VPSNHSKSCICYIDESGDLGFRRGASQHFVIALLCVDAGKASKINRFVGHFKRKCGIKAAVELKASATKQPRRLAFCKELAGLPCSVHYIVVNKSRVGPKLRRDTNILYNYVCGLLLVPLLEVLQTAEIEVDCRTIKVASGNSLHDYLRIKLWCEKNAHVDVRFRYVDSLHSEGIQAADFVANAIFRRYEWGDSSSYTALARILRTRKKLYFKA